MTLAFVAPIWLNAQTNVFPSTGNAGIGITSPNAKLEIRGTTDNSFIYVRQDKNSGGSGDLFFVRDDRGYAGINSGTTFKIESWKGLGFQGGTLANFITIDNGLNKSRFFINNDNGYVGLGTVTPQVQFQVDGGSGLQGRLRVSSPFVGSSAAFDVTMGTADDNIGAGMKAYVPANQPGFDRVFLGLYTTSFSGSLQSRVERVTITDNGNVGVGTLSPRSSMEIRKDDASFYITANNATGGGLGTPSLYINRISEGLKLEYVPNVLARISNTFDGASGNIAFATRGVDRLFITGNGNIGIGTTEPDKALTVKGAIHTNEVIVDLDSPIQGPDYVFEKNYDLLSLSELEAYINANKHLPEIPSANEMAANGLNLKEMNLLLLKKVEELTLHLIETKKIIDLQQSEIGELKKKIK